MASIIQVRTVYLCVCHLGKEGLKYIKLYFTSRQAYEI